MWGKGLGRIALLHLFDLQNEQRVVNHHLQQILRVQEIRGQLLIVAVMVHRHLLSLFFKRIKGLVWVILSIAVDQVLDPFPYQVLVHDDSPVEHSLFDQR